MDFYFANSNFYKSHIFMKLELDKSINPTVFIWKIICFLLYFLLFYLRFKLKIFYTQLWDSCINRYFFLTFYSLYLNCRRMIIYVRIVPNILVSVDLSTLNNPKAVKGPSA